MIFSTTIAEARPGVTGIPVPPNVLEELGGGKKPLVVVTVGTLTYRTAVGTMGGVSLLPLSKDHRASAGVEAGQEVEVRIELDTEPRTVDLPDDLAAALDHAGVRAAFDALSPSKRKAHVTSVEGAKTEDTRSRRVESVVTALRDQD